MGKGRERELAVVPDGEPEPSTAAAELYAAYEGHSSTLRTWLVAYGIGGPVLFLTSESVWKTIAESGSATLVGGLFLVGVALQVALSALNKATMWACYYGEIEERYQTTRRYRTACWVARQFWIDLATDLLTMGLFGYATFRCSLS